MTGLIALFFLLVGGFFCIMGVVGNLRLPDVFTRLHATSKITSIGMVSLVIASALLVPESTPKAIVLSVFIILTSPVASQAISRTAYRDGCAIVGLVQNDLSVQYVDFPYNYTIGEEVPWAHEADDDEIHIDLELPEDDQPLA